MGAAGPEEPEAAFGLPEKIVEVDFHWGRSSEPLFALAYLFLQATDGHVAKSSGQTVRDAEDPLSDWLLSMDRCDAEVTTAAVLRGGAILRWRTNADEVLVLASLGGPAAPPTLVQRLGTLEDLRQIIPASTPVGYRGCDAAYHYFRVPSGGAYGVPRSAWHITPMPVTLGFCIPLVFDETRLVIPSPEWSLRLDLLSLQWTLDQ